MVQMELTEKEANLIREIRLVEKAHGDANVVTIVGDSEVVELVNDLGEMARQAKELPFEGNLFGLVVKVPHSPSLRRLQFTGLMGLISSWYADPDLLMRYGVEDDVEAVQGAQA